MATRERRCEDCHHARRFSDGSLVCLHHMAGITGRNVDARPIFECGPSRTLFYPDPFSRGPTPAERVHDLLARSSSRGERIRTMKELGIMSDDGQFTASDGGEIRVPANDRVRAVLRVEQLGTRMGRLWLDLSLDDEKLQSMVVFSGDVHKARELCGGLLILSNGSLRPPGPSREQGLFMAMLTGMGYQPHIEPDGCEVLEAECQSFQDFEHDFLVYLSKIPLDNTVTP